MTDTDYGTMYCAYRAAEAGQTYWRFANFLLPFWTQTPQGPFDRVNTRAWVPMDDTHTMFVSLELAAARRRRSARCKNGQMVPGSRLAFDYLPNTTDWYGRWRLDAEPVERLDDRPRGAEERRDLYRHRQHPRPGPGGDREHGRDHRPRLRESGAERPDDRPHPPSPAARRPRARQGRHGAARRRRSRTSTPRCAAAISSPTRRSPGATPTKCRCAPQCVRSRKPRSERYAGAFGTSRDCWGKA